MTTLEIYNLAWLKALDNWHYWVNEDELNRCEITEIQREKAWIILNEMKELYLKEMEKNEKK
jgi:hypothetical protein